jgi:hypothetical protein
LIDPAWEEVGMATDTRALVQRFEPLLHFHKDERFFPSDAKRYLEHCELWTAVGDLAVNGGVQRTLKDNWGSLSGDHRVPLINRGAVSAEAGEPGTYIDVTGTFVADDGLQERFLDLAGWLGGDAVNATSENAYADFDKIATLYGPAPEGGDAALHDSLAWYHAELFSAERLRQSMGSGTWGLTDEVTKLLNAVAKDPALLCYYFFFPGHDEGLSGCQGEPTATFWASCAGDWQCLAILLDRPGPDSEFAPIFAGFTNRYFRAVGFVGLEPRVGMNSSIVEWAHILAVGEHPMLFVAKGTHGIYTADTDTTFILSSPDDPSVQNCGRYEGIAAESDDDINIVIDKVIAGAALGFLGGAILGLAAGVIEGLIRNPASDLDTEEGAPAIDELPKGQYSRVMRPPGIGSPLAPDAPGPIWPRFTDDPNDPLTTFIDGRRYSLIVGTKADPLGETSRPAWLPSFDGTSGFRGRWGNRVTTDPFSRRAGPHFPNFAAMFLRALAAQLSH